MKFGNLINFQPIESVIQIKDSNDESKATEYVKTLIDKYKISYIYVGEEEINKYGDKICFKVII